MKKALFFDLDGTLLPMEYEPFFRAYLKSIAGFCANLLNPHLFIEYLLDSTEKMLQNDGLETNEEVFMRYFLPQIGYGKDEVYPLLEDYYATDFKKLKDYTKPSDLAPKIIESALAAGWDVVLATNPLFPLTAIKERMRWAGIDNFSWLHITSYETSRFCKPNLSYYQEIIQLLSLKPQDCWMIGNDCHEDMVAKKIGFRTYLVKDCLIKKDENFCKPDQEGTLAELLSFVNNGMPER